MCIRDRYVKDRLALCELPKEARSKVDAGEWGIADGVAASKLVDQPDVFAEVLDARSGMVEYTIRSVVAKSEFTARGDQTCRQSDGFRGDGIGS